MKTNTFDFGEGNYVGDWFHKFWSDDSQFDDEYDARARLLLEDLKDVGLVDEDASLAVGRRWLAFEGRMTE